MSRKILVVEDDPATAEYLLRGLAEEGYVTDHAADGRDGLFHATDGSYGLIILDRMLPGIDGLSLLRALRAAEVKTPVLMLSALGSVDERIEGLRGGSDDYLVKPFSFAELLARADALFRRSDALASSAATTKLTVGDLEIDLLARDVRRGGKLIELMPREYRLLEYLARNAGQVITRTMLLEQVWDYHFDPGTNVIDVHISRLRRKLEDGFDTPLLQTVRGAGYRLAANS